MSRTKTSGITGLTPQKLKILKLIQESLISQHYSPTIQELAQKLKKSRATVFEHCEGLREKGFLSTSPGKARSLKLTQLAEDILDNIAKRSIQQKSETEKEGIPLIGTVAAGMPVEAVETKERLSLGETFGNTSEAFALEVSGESMIEENICPGDYVICKRSKTARNGDLVVALVDGTETTLKRFYKEKGHIRLQPANAKYEPIITQDCVIEAHVVGLIRKI